MQTPLGLTTVGLLVIFVTVGILIRGRVNPIGGIKRWMRHA